MSENRLASRARRATSRALCAALVSGSAILALCHGASAQFAFEDEILPPRVIAWRLADRGFSGVSRPRFDGRVYVVDAVSPTGVPMRLFVDPAAGAIVGRQRLGAPESYARLERPVPGFGWTEEDAAPRRVLRPVTPEEDAAPRRILRPATPDDVPPPAARPLRRANPEALRPDANPDGLNPDGRARPDAPRKVARAAQPGRQPEAKPALRTTPEAPAPKIAPAEAAKADPADAAKPDTKSAAIEKAPEANPATANAAPAKPASGAVAEAPKPAAQDWKDPPPDKKPVRIIGGATIVPGPSEKEPSAAQ